MGSCCLHAQGSAAVPVSTGALDLRPGGGDIEEDELGAASPLSSLLGEQVGAGPLSLYSSDSAAAAANTVLAVRGSKCWSDILQLGLQMLKSAIDVTCHGFIALSNTISCSVFTAGEHVASRLPMVTTTEQLTRSCTIAAMLYKLVGGVQAVLNQPHDTEFLPTVCCATST